MTKPVVDPARLELRRLRYPPNSRFSPEPTTWRCPQCEKLFMPPPNVCSCGTQPGYRE